jgi:hypothetical protein
MSDRASVFDSGADFDVSGFVPQKPQPAAPKEAVEKVSKAASFKSREPVEPKVTRREARLYRTGRNAQFNIKADPEIVNEFYRITEAQGWVLGETLENAVNALKREISAGKGRE